MKVVYFAHSLLSRGGDKMVLAHAAWLAAHGHDVELCCNVVDTVLNIPESVRVSRPSLPGISGTVVSAILCRRDADVVLASIIPMACFLFLRSRQKVVYFAQDYDESYYTSPFLKGLIRSFYFIGLKLFQIPTIAVSRPLASLLCERFRARVSVVENGVDSGVFYPDPDQDLVTSKANRKALLLLSRHDLRKGFDLGVKILNNLPLPSNYPLDVWTVGESCAGLFPRWRHRDFGYVCEAELRRIMSSADVFFYPTRHEGLPLMPLEAMACGCSVVTTTAVPYAVHMDNALVAQVEDCKSLTEQLQKLLDDNDLQNRLIESGQRFSSKQSLSEAMRQFEEKLTGMPR